VRVFQVEKEDGELEFTNKEEGLSIFTECEECRNRDFTHLNHEQSSDLKDYIAGVAPTEYFINNVTYTGTDAQTEFLRDFHIVANFMFDEHINEYVGDNTFEIRMNDITIVSINVAEKTVSYINTQFMQTYNVTKYTDIFTCLANVGLHYDPEV